MGPGGAPTVPHWDSFDEVRQSFPAGLIDILTDGKVAAFRAPTKIQAYCWPSLLNGDDVIGVAKTGSGKTLAFLLPGFIAVKMKNHNPETMGPKLLVLAPTRELCQQIYEESEKFGEPAGIHSACAYGGAPRSSQLRTFRRGPHVCIGCPGRLFDFLESGEVRLDHADYVVLDEADRMLDMGFEPQIRQIMAHVPRERQTALFTATWPEDVRAVARDLCYQDAVHIQVGTGDTLTSNADITQRVMVVNHDGEKFSHLNQILGDMSNSAGGVLVFCSTKKMCQQLFQQLVRFNPVTLHGDMDQRERSSAMAQFKRGSAKVMVATDVASRGLDLRNISVVVNYDAPNSAEDYVHRIGRTGRAGDRGEAFTFLSTDDTARARDIVMVMNKTGQEVPDDLMRLAKMPLRSSGRSRYNSRLRM
eukprot:GEMP01059597.1.p1 GENE.GEMP01059597.1~~GEMP01059597.1.p1  ORF type:complete len:418 (+),score=59.38 GEMP01059597.1:183-1436(+)